MEKRLDNNPLFYVRCLPEQQGILLDAGKIYGVQEIMGDFYKIKTGVRSLSGWFHKERFEPTIIKEINDCIEKVLNE